METAKNAFEESNRQKKALKLVAQIDAALVNVGIDPVRDGLRMVRGFTSTEWRAFARRAETKEPSDATKAVVLEHFAVRADAAALKAEADEEEADALLSAPTFDAEPDAAKRDHDQSLHAFGAGR